MLDPDLVDRLSVQSERVAEKCFKKLRLRPKRIPRHRHRRPDFNVLDARGPALIAEVKTILSAGAFKDSGITIPRSVRLPDEPIQSHSDSSSGRGALLSTHDPAFFQVASGKVWMSEDCGASIDDAIEDARQQYQSLCADEPDKARLPFLVVLFVDFFADSFDLVSLDRPGWEEVSGIAKVERDWEIQRLTEGMSLEKLDRILDGEERLDLSGVTNTKRFLLATNCRASNPLPPWFVESCISPPPAGD